jgi:hypothetical protein
VKLAICTPSSGLVRIEWTESLTNIVKNVLRDPYNKIKDVKLFFFCSSNIPANRNHVINHALQWGATHLLFIDDDMRFPVEAFKALWKNHKMPIIGANCIKRKYPIEYMAVGFDGQIVSSTGKTGHEEVMFTGFSFVMIQADVFRKVPKPWTAFPYMAAYDDYGTEDYFFFESCKAHGFPVVIDHDISQLIQHIGSHVFDPLSERGQVVTNESPD